MKVWAMTRGFVPFEQRESYVDEYRQESDIEDILKNCDYIVNTLPSTIHTRGLLSGNILSICQKKPVFINVGRGDVIDEKTIISALRNGWISKAILDVFEIEPLPTSSQLWQEPGVIISPHTAYGLFPSGDYEQITQAFLENYHRFLKGQTLVGQVSVENGY